MGEVAFVKWFSELSNKDIAVAGGKGASLSEMYNADFPVPPGFMVTAQAYEYFIKDTGLDKKIKLVVDHLDVEDTHSLQEASKKIRHMIESENFSRELESEIIEAYEILGSDKKKLSGSKSDALAILRNSYEPPFVAVRSSATTEDLADASFAGQQDSFLGVKGNENLIRNIKMCFSSLFTARAIYYRKKKGFSTSQALLAVVVQKMIDSKKSGVMFSKNPVKKSDEIVIEAVWGLGEGIVSGAILPDHYVVSREMEITETEVADKKIAMVRNPSGKIETVKLTSERSKEQVLTNFELKKLAYYAVKLEEHYRKPQDIEFAIDEEIYIVQSRPITTKVQEAHEEVEGNVLLSGLPASPGVGSGVVRIVHSLEELSKVQRGDILVTKMTNPDMVVSMQKASGIITDEGGITSHAAIVSREMGIPAVVGTKQATHLLKDGQIVTVDGSAGKVIEGRGEEKKVVIEPIVPTKTKIKVIVDLPEYASRAALTKAEAVGLVRLEAMIALSGKHPAWFVKNNATKEYISFLHQQMKKISIPFKDVWFRTSDVRSDEYRNLKGAPQEVEGNPMMGFHGIRFSLRNTDLLESEMTALKEVADDFPAKKFGLMMPQLISVEEFVETKKIAHKIKMPTNVKLGIMVETPAAVQIIEELCEAGIEFVSFGTNDLTQFTLAVDRNNPEVQEIYNEMHPAVLKSLKHVIGVCRRYGVETSICGQAGSRPEMAAFLVRAGINSISANADAARKVSMIIAEIEKNEPIQEELPQSRVEEKHMEIKHHKSTPKHIPHIDEEQLILAALDGENEYNPSVANPKQDIPPLNEAIPITSDYFEESKQIDEIEFNSQNELKDDHKKDSLDIFR